MTTHRITVEVTTTLKVEVELEWDATAGLWDGMIESIEGFDLTQGKELWERLDIKVGQSAHETAISQLP